MGRCTTSGEAIDFLMCVCMHAQTHSLTYPTQSPMYSPPNTLNAFLVKLKAHCTRDPQDGGSNLWDGSSINKMV